MASSLLLSPDAGSVYDKGDSMPGTRQQLAATGPRAVVNVISSAAESCPASTSAAASQLARMEVEETTSVLAVNRCRAAEDVEGRSRQVPPPCPQGMTEQGRMGGCDSSEEEEEVGNLSSSEGESEDEVQDVAPCTA